MIPDQYKIKCEGCGKILDIRDINILCHGWIENGIIVCYKETLEQVECSEIGSSVMWTKEKEMINLN